MTKSHTKNSILPFTGLWLLVTDKLDLEMCLYFFVFFSFLIFFFCRNVFLKIKESHPRCGGSPHIVLYIYIDR